MATVGRISSDTCSICANKCNIKHLPCLHRLCLKCMHQFACWSFKDGKIICPVCTSQEMLPEEEVTGLQTNVCFEESTEKEFKSAGQCCGLNEHNMSDVFTQSEIHPCVTCARGRENIPSTRSQQLIDVADYEAEKQVLSMLKFCEKYVDEKFRCSSKLCSEDDCQDCESTDSDVQEVKDVPDVAAEARNDLEKTKETLEIYKTKTDKSYDNITRKKKALSKHNKKTKAGINAFADRFVNSLRNIINKSRTKQLKRVTDEEKKQMKMLSDEQNTLTQRKSFLQNQLDQSERVLREGLDDDVISTDGEMKQRLKELEIEPSIGSDSGSRVYIPPYRTANLWQLETVRCTVSDIMINFFPESEKIVSLDVVKVINCFWVVHSISFTKSQQFLSVEGYFPYLCLLDGSSTQPIWKLSVEIDELKKLGIHGVIHKHNELNPDNEIPADDYTNLKKPFPSKDINDVGDRCSVIDDYNIVVIKPVNGDVRTLSFNPFVEAEQQFEPKDVCWGRHQEVYIADGGAGVIVVYSLQDGFQKSFKTPSEYHLSAIAMDREGNLWVGDTEGYIHVCSVN